jgi:hypothetical protein
MSPVVVLPRAAEPLLGRLGIAFTSRTFQRFLLLFVGSVLALGRHTVTGVLWTVRTLVEGSGHFTDYHRVFSRARWSLWPLARVLAAMVLELVPGDEPAVRPVDDTTPQHKGKHVYGKGRHRDNCRSTRSHTVWVFGHKWVVLAVNVHFAFASRPWALPVLAALYRPKELDEKEGRRHRTAIDLARQLMAALIHWFPRRKFVLLGDGGYASHELARFCWRHRRHVSLVSLLHPRANLYSPPPTRRKGRPGRPRVRGAKLPAPQDAVAAARRKRSTVGWYGGKTRRVEFVSGTGQWYKGGGGLVPVRWVFVHDLDGTHEDRYFYSTDPSLSPSRIVTLYTGRWGIEVTFQEVRRHLGFGTPELDACQRPPHHAVPAGALQPRVPDPPPPHARRRDQTALDIVVREGRAHLRRRLGFGAAAAVVTDGSETGGPARRVPKTPAGPARDPAGPAHPRGVTGGEGQKSS